MEQVVILSSDCFLGRLVERSLAGLGVGRCCVEQCEELERLLGRGGVALVLLLEAAPLISRAESLSVMCHKRGRVPLFLISWHHSEQMALALLERGVDQCMTFPLSFTRLRRKVSEVVDKRMKR